MSGVRIVEIAEGDGDQRFDRWVKKHYPALGHVQLQKLLRTGQFRLDGKRVKAGDRVQPGQSVRIPPLEVAERRERPGVSERDARFIRSLVIHEDDELIVIDKPAGLAVQGGSKTTRHVDGMLDAFGKESTRPRLVHRLDRDTSGVLVLARNAAVARELMHAFQGHSVRKLYWAVVQGKPERNEGLIDLRLGKSGPPGQERMTSEAIDARRAQTDFRVIARSGKIGAWVGLMPVTGRTHQLRAHMEAIGTPIMGDGKYGGERPSTAPAGLMLHARELFLPRSGGRPPLSVKADPPRHFVEGLAWLGLSPEAIPYSAIADWDKEE